MSSKVRDTIVDWFLSPLCVGVSISVQGETIYHRHTSLEGPVSDGSLEQSQHKTLSTMRDMMSRIDQKLLRHAYIRVIYGGDLYYAEPYHKTTRFQEPMVVTQTIQADSMQEHIRDITARSQMNIFSHKKLTEFKIYEHTVKGFPYVGSDAVYEYTVHGFVGWIDATFALKIERLLFLSGCIDTNIQSLTFSAYIPTLVKSALPMSKRQNSVFVYDIGMHVTNLTTTHDDLPYMAVRVPVGYEKVSSREFFDSMLEQTLSLCINPSGSLEIVIIVPKEQSDTVQSGIQPVFQALLYTHPHYKISVQYIILDMDTDIRSAFSQCFVS
jgi:hypothetical protein